MEYHKSRIKKLLKTNPRGMTITDISDRININRNSVARYMDVLTISGHVEMRQLGPAKLFYLSQRVPMSAMLNFSSDHILVLDDNLKIIQINENFLELMNTKREAILDKKIEEFPNPSFKSQEMISRTKEVLEGKEINFEKKFQIAELELYLDIRMLPTIFEDGSKGVTWILHDITKRKRMEEEREGLLHNLGERIKELQCLYEISKLVEKPDISLEEILQGTKELLPPAWQYPEVTCSRIILENKEFKTRNYKETPWKQSSDINIHGKKAGVVEVYYLEEKPSIAEGPFLKEERNLITAIAERLGKIVERKKAEKDLKEANFLLRERVKELTFFYKAIREMQKSESLEDLGPKLVDFLVPAMQFPEIAAPMLEIEGVRFVHKNYRENLTHGIHEKICVNDHTIGRVSVYYTEDRPFIIPQEQNMIKALAETLGAWLKNIGANIAQN